MGEASPVVRAARNGFGVLLVALLAASIYQFAFVKDSSLIVPALWTLGAGVFYASKYYYDRTDPDSSD
jgi:hypothetical protein